MLPALIWIGLLIGVLSSLDRAAAQEQEGAQLEWTAQYGVKIATKKPGDCSTRVKKGDIVYIRHHGIFIDQGGKMTQFDGDGGAPLRFVVGEKRIIAGMELGVIGQVGPSDVPGCQPVRPCALSPHPHGNIRARGAWSARSCVCNLRFCIHISI